MFRIKNSFKECICIILMVVNEFLVKYKYDPKIHITYDEDGIIIPTEDMSEDFINDIKIYFSQRNEDDI